ncbi:TPA: Flp pilus assembly complex ATPase component TadA [Campylobacter lari]|nr:Flp pilus assembly complex ATPase component TadA [Campylobacter lari]
MSIVLNNILEILRPYLELNANELIFNRPCEIQVDRGDVWETIEDEKLTYQFLETFLIELATRRNQRFDEKHCHLSCELPAPFLRYRVQAQHKTSLFNSDICICIRIPSKTRFSLENFVLDQKCIDKGWNYEKIKELIKNKKNILVSGGTGSGKTSFLNSLMGEINPEERIVTIEDSQELFIENKNKTQLAVPKEESEIYSYQTAINNAMRLRPDRLFLGEIDIRNTFTFLRVNNTGHAGNLSTLHANNPEDAIKAIISNIILGGGLNNPDRKMLEELIITAVDFIIQIERNKSTGKRHITDILDLKNDYAKLLI